MRLIIADEKTKIILVLETRNQITKGKTMKNRMQSAYKQFSSEIRHALNTCVTEKHNRCVIGITELCGYYPMAALNPSLAINIANNWLGRRPVYGNAGWVIRQHKRKIWQRYMEVLQALQENCNYELHPQHGYYTVKSAGAVIGYVHRSRLRDFIADISKVRNARAICCFGGGFDFTLV